jgi:Rrf2 family protein
MEVSTVVSTRGRYALRLMIDIAINGGTDGYVSLKDVSKRQEISVKYLEQIVSILNRTGLLTSARGASGGYKLAKKPSEYTAGEILRAAEGSLAPIVCVQNGFDDCNHMDNCGMLPFWQGYNDAVNDYVDSVTLEKLANDMKNTQ